MAAVQKIQPFLWFDMKKIDIARLEEAKAGMAAGR
jgi:hypothetical protein